MSLLIPYLHLKCISEYQTHTTHTSLGIPYATYSISKRLPYTFKYRSHNIHCLNNHGLNVLLARLGLLTICYSMVSNSDWADYMKPNPITRQLELDIPACLPIPPVDTPVILLLPRQCQASWRDGISKGKSGDWLALCNCAFYIITLYLT